MILKLFSGQLNPGTCTGRKERHILSPAAFFLRTSTSMLPESEMTRREYFEFSTRPLGLQNMKFGLPTHLHVNRQCDVHHMKLWKGSQLGCEIFRCVFVTRLRDVCLPKYGCSFGKLPNGLDPPPLSLFGNYIALFSRKYDQNIPLRNQQNLQCNFLDRK